MSYAIKHALSEVKWADGSGIDLPVISRSQNGWVYRPPEAITRGSGKSFGKGYDGDERAQKWLAERIHAAFERHNWELPVNITKLTGRPMVPSSGLQVGWEHPVFGLVYVNLVPEMRYSPHMTMQLYYNVLAEDMANRRIEYHKDLTKVVAIKTNQDNFLNGKLLDEYNLFKENPWKYIWQGAKLTPQLRDMIAPTTELPDIDYTGTKAEDTDTAWYRMSGNLDLIFPENAKKAIITNLAELERVLEAFAHLGFTVEVRYAYGYAGDDKGKIPSGLTVTLPKHAIKGQEEMHQIRFTGNGVNVTCGYVEDEARYLDYKQRQAVQFFEDVFEEEWTTQDNQL
jgi:hypothetical protein